MRCWGGYTEGIAGPEPVEGLAASGSAGASLAFVSQTALTCVLSFS